MHTFFQKLSKQNRFWDNVELFNGVDGKSMENRNGTFENASPPPHGEEIAFEHYSATIFPKSIVALIRGGFAFI